MLFQVTLTLKKGQGDTLSPSITPRRREYPLSIVPKQVYHRSSAAGGEHPMLRLC